LSSDAVLGSPERVQAARGARQTASVNARQDSALTCSATTNVREGSGIKLPGGRPRKVSWCEKAVTFLVV